MHLPIAAAGGDEDEAPLDPELLEEDALATDDEASGDGIDGDGVSEDGSEGGADGGADGAAAKSKEALEEEEDLPDPKLAKAPVPSRPEMLAALEKAFASEEVLPGVLERYADHAIYVLEGNKRVNLTAIVDPWEVAVKHYLDCWRATRWLPLMGRSVLDLGSGAGYPGMPTALCEDMCKVTVCDSRKRKAEFMAESIEDLKVKNAKAVWARGEEHLITERYDVVFMRALSSVRENVRLLRKVRHSFKDLVLFKGPSWSREVRAAEREADRLGFQLDTVMEHELPDEMGKRAILVYRAPGAQ